MGLVRDLFLAVAMVAGLAQAIPGGSYHHVHHRIHVPQKIKTVYHTKIIKVPEHHHHFHEKEKIIIEKEPPKIEHHPIFIKEKDNHEEDWSGFESSNYFKKKRNAQHPLEVNKNKVKKRKIIQHHPYKIHKH